MHCMIFLMEFKFHRINSIHWLSCNKDGFQILHVPIKKQSEESAQVSIMNHIHTKLLPFC